MLFAGAFGAESTGVFTAVTGVDGNHNRTLTAGHWRGRRQLGRCRFHGHRHHRAHTRRRINRHRHTRRGRAASRDRFVCSGTVSVAVIQINHQSMAVLLVGRQAEAFGRDRRRQVDNQAQIRGTALRRANAGDRRIAQRQRLKLGRQLRPGHIDDDAIRRTQGKHAVLHRPGQVKHQAGVIRCAPQPYAAQIGGGRQHIASQQRQQHTQPSRTRAQAHCPSHYYCSLARAAHHDSPRAP